MKTASVTTTTSSATARLLTSELGPRRRELTQLLRLHNQRWLALLRVTDPSDRHHLDQVGCARLEGLQFVVNDAHARVLGRLDVGDLTERLLQTRYRVLLGDDDRIGLHVFRWTFLPAKLYGGRRDVGAEQGCRGFG